MPSGVYNRKKMSKAHRLAISNGRKKSMGGGNITDKYELVIAHMDTINHILKLLESIKKNKIGKIK